MQTENTITLGDIIGEAASSAIVAAHEATQAAQAKRTAAAAKRASRTDTIIDGNGSVANRSPRSGSASAEKRAKSDNGKAAAKRVASKPEKPAKPTAEAREAAQRAENDSRRLARDVAARAVAAFYNGPSKPFKAASDRFSDINANNGKSASTRQAGLLLALITYGANNMRPDGTFTRGAFVVPARLLNPNAKPGDTIRAQPESGCLGNMLGRVCDYVSGPTTGREQSAAVYRLRVKPALAEIQAAFGDKQAAAATKLLASYGKRAEKQPTA